METNELYWNRVKHKYPWHSITRGVVINPRRVEAELGVEILSVPLDGRQLWGFETASDRAKFNDLFNGENHVEA